MASPAHAIALVYCPIPGTTDYEIFVGQETYYINNPATKKPYFDLNPTDTDAMILSNPIFTGHPEYTFQRRQQQKPTGAMSYKFTVQAETSPAIWGLPKGGKEPTDTSTAQTAKREFWEEVGYNLETAMIGAPTTITVSNRSSHLYMIQVDVAEKARIEEAYKNKMCTRNGELHKGRFLDFASAYALPLNALSKLALKQFSSAIRGIVVPGGGGFHARGRRRTFKQRK